MDKNRNQLVIQLSMWMLRLIVLMAVAPYVIHVGDAVGFFLAIIDFIACLVCALYISAYAYLLTSR